MLQLPWREPSTLPLSLSLQGRGEPIPQRYSNTLIPRLIVARPYPVAIVQRFFPASH